jgi:N-acetylglucosaminyldiphosphoundecaprenol N-acetyl-beta-D-mannosaminyltransferase
MFRNGFNKYIGEIMTQTHSKNEEISKASVLGIGFSRAKKEQILEYIIRGLDKNDEKFYVVTPNPEILVIASKDLEYKRVVNEARLASVDGVGVLFAGKVLGKEVGERLTGIELLETLSKRVADRPITVGYLGAGPGVAESVAECLQKKHPDLKIVFVHGGGADEETVDYINSAMAKKEGRKTIDLLFVAFGSPKQELWIAKNLEKLPVRVAIGVGGAFDFVSGKVKRAPKLFQTLGLEWFFRLLNQPWRIKRQLSLITFLSLVFQERFGRKF